MSSDITVDEIKALNEVVAAMEQQGIAVFPETEHFSRTYKKVNKSLSLRSNLGQSTLSAVVENEEIPNSYRSALEVGLRTQTLSATLEGIGKKVSAEKKLRYALGKALLPVLIIVTLAYLGFILLCFGYTPKLESMYTQIGADPSLQVTLLVALQNVFPYWAIAVPLVVVLLVTSWYLGWVDLKVIPGAKRYSNSIRDAVFANQLARLLNAGESIQECLPLAAKVTGDQDLIEECCVLADREFYSEDPTRQPTEKGTLAPLLHWALSRKFDNQSLPELLGFAEKIYLQRANLQAKNWQILLPTLVMAIVGGAIVLFYAIAVFSPYVQLYHDLSEHAL